MRRGRRRDGRAHHLRALDMADLAREVRLLADQHAALRRLCDRLEGIADDLPRLPEAVERDAACDALRLLVPQHRQHEQALLARLFPTLGDTPAGRRMLGHIDVQHELDEIHAQDLGAALEAPAALHPEALGYMLRCFFDGCRRALAFEELALLTLGRQHLPAAPLAILAGSLEP